MRAFSSLARDCPDLIPMRGFCSMAKRREAWQARGWTEYVHVDVSPDTPTAPVEVVEVKAPAIPQKIYGEHVAAEEDVVA